MMLEGGETMNLWSLSLILFALGPQAINTFSTSFPLERAFALDLETLHRLHEARPSLEGVSVLAALGLLLAHRSGRVSRAALVTGLGGFLALQGVSHLITAQPAHPAYRGPLTILGAGALASRLTPDAPVVGVFVNGEPRCYPLALLVKPAVVSDTVGGVPIAAIVCPMSHAVLALHDDWRGERLGLQAVGAPNNDLALYADGPKGVISQLHARVMTGPHRGEALRAYPATLTSWARWRELHPQTTGAWWETGLKGAYLEKLLFATMASDAQSDTPLYATRRIDRRLPIKQQVLGVRVGADARVFTRDEMKNSPVIEEVVGNEPVVVLFDPERDMARCFLRRHRGRLLAFEAVGPGLMRDATGRTWDVAGNGPDGERLEPVELVVDRVYWFAWAYIHPQTRLSKVAEPPGLQAPL